MKLKKYKLYEIADLNTSSISNSDNTLSEIIYLDTSSITENVILSTYKVSIHEAPSRAQRRVKKNTILYSTVRPRLKHYGILSSPEANLIVSTGFVTIDVKSEFQDSVDARFLFLLLTQPHITEYIASIADSAVSAYPSFNPSDISALEFEFPEMNIQTHIADIWEYYDSKIGLNRQINDNLEAMAKQLYDYWFVQFDFPNEEGKPYKSSGGAMVWNEKLKREIPQGWSTLPISAILDKYSTTKRYETKEYLSQGKYPIIDQGDTYIVGYTNEDDNLLTRHPAVLFGDHSTKVKFLDFDFARGADGTQILYSSNDAVSQYYLYLAVSTLQIPNPGYSRHFKYLKELPIAIPSLSIAIKFANIVKPLFKKWTNNIFNNIALTKQRDELLPLLMNGQASVNSD